MFGDILLIGNATVNFDGKNRIVIPSFTKVETDDKLLIEKAESEYGDYKLRIHSYQKYYEFIKKLIQKQDNCTTREEFIKLDIEIGNLCRVLEALVTVERQRRITIPTGLFNELKWDKHETVNCKGCGSYLEISQLKR